RAELHQHLGGGGRAGERGGGHAPVSPGSLASASRPAARERQNAQTAGHPVKPHDLKSEVAGAIHPNEGGMPYSPRGGIFPLAPRSFTSSARAVKCCGGGACRLPGVGSFFLRLSREH